MTEKKLEPALTDARREESHRNAMAYAEANTYSLNNPYLSREQKAGVEAVYQFPLGAFTYSLGFFALGGGAAFWNAYFSACMACVLAMFACMALMRAKWFVLSGTFFAGSLAMIIHLGIAAYALFEGRSGVAAFVGLQAFGLMAFFIPSMWLWPVFVGGGMHPKYRIAKRMFGIVFPFEGVGTGVSGDSPGSIAGLPPISSADLAKYPPELQLRLVETDSVVRQYRGVLMAGASNPSTPLIRDAADLPIPRDGIKNSLLLLAVYWSSKGRVDARVLAAFREVYSKLAFFRPTLSDVFEELGPSPGFSSMDRASLLRAGTAIGHTTDYSPAEAGEEAARLKAEFDARLEEMLLEAKAARSA